MRNIITCLSIFAIVLFLNSCNKITDNGSRGFLSKATIIGSSDKVYYCYLDHGGLVLSHDAGLEGVERGYFSISYMESDWTKSSEGLEYINNAHVRAWDRYGVYDVVTPINRNDDKAEQIIHNDKNQIPTLWSISHSRGYIDLNMGIATFNGANGSEIRSTINLIYDPMKQKADTLSLQLCCNLNLPTDWKNTSETYGEISCDISSLAELQQWKDSVVIVIETGNDKKHLTKISKRDFEKPTAIVDE